MCIGLGLNSGLQSVRVVTNYLSHGKALLVLCVNGRGLGEDVRGHFSIVYKMYDVNTFTQFDDALIYLGLT